jgi:PadR family transcriptional regulator PadR
MASRSQLLKGVLDACVMAVVEAEPVYGYELSEKLRQIGLPNISDGTIYPVLLRLQKNGYIRGEMKPSASGPDRKYYFLTDSGKEELEGIAGEWQQIAAPVSILLQRGGKNDND